MRLWGESGHVDRATGLRADHDAIANLWHGPARVIIVGERGGVVARTVESEERHWLSTYATGETELAWESPAGRYHGQKHTFLGLLDGIAYFVLPRPGAPATPLRELLPQLNEADQELALAAVAVTTWHRDSPHCPHCGGPTRRVQAGFARHCDSCDTELFPRQDPAIIVAIVDDADRLLLGRQHTWPEGKYSLLAGFVEAGESLEQCVHREVREEVGLELDSLNYVGSQPWPFPRSLMCAYVAHPAGTDITIDGQEITDAQFFTREEYADKIECGEIKVTASASVSAYLIQSWLDGNLKEAVAQGLPRVSSATKPKAKKKAEPVIQKPAKRGW